MCNPEDWCVGRHDWECWWTENVDVCRSCEKEKRCRHKSDRKARAEEMNRAAT